MRTDRKTPLKTDKKAANRSHKRGIVGYNKKTALLEDAITQMNAGKYGRSSTALKELLALDPHNMEARRLFATLHLRLGSLIPARQAFDSLINEAFERQDYWLAESLLREYLAAGPRCVPYLEKLGSVFERKGNTSEAVAEYEKAVAILIEDPDPENPHYATQLYAKIKDLAPANPIAFRLASCFDAETGELVARPSAARGESAAVTPPAPLVEETPSASSIPEPMTGLMAWEKVEEASGSMPLAAVPEPARSAESPVSPDVPIVASQEAGALVETPVVLEPSREERSESALYAQTEAQGESQREGNLCTSPGTSASIGTSDLTAGDSIERAPRSIMSDHAPESVVPNILDEPFAPPDETESNDTIQADLTSSQTPENQAYDSPSPHLQQGTEVDSISPPMPWEDILESIITIPEPLPNGASAPSNLAEEASAVAPCEIGSAALDPGEPGQAVPSAPVVDEPVQMGLVTEEPAVTPLEPLPTQAPESTSTEPAKPGRFSWQSVFNAAWKFGDKPASNGPQPEAAQVESPQIEEPPPATISSPQSASPEIESVDIPESATVSQLPDPSAAPVVAPMPWDQVEDSIVTIPPAEDQETVTDLSIDQSGPSSGPEEPDLELFQKTSPEQAQSEPSVTPASGAPETDSVSIAQAPPAPPVSEPEFRFAGSVPSHPVQDEHVFNTDMAPASTPESEVSESEVLMSGDSEAPVATNTSVVSTVSDSPLAQQEPVSIAPPIDAPSAFVPEVHAGPVEALPESMFSPLMGDDAEPPARPSAGAEQASGLAEPLTPDAISDRIPAHPESVVEPDLASVGSTGEPSHTKTDEQMAETHRPASRKRRKRAAVEPEPEIALSPVSSEEILYRPAEQSQQQDEVVPAERVPLPSEAGIRKDAPQKEEWVRTGETIRFIEEPKVSTVMDPAPQAPMQAMTEVTQSMSPAAAAVDVLFESSGESTRKETRGHAVDTASRRKRRSRLTRIGTGISSFLGSCFSTTRSIVMSLVALAALSGALMAIAIGAVGLTWIIMEKPPSPAFQNLTASPQRTLSDAKKNGYLLLLGFDAPADQDPIQAGYERQPDPKDADMALACLGAIGGGQHSGQSNATAGVVNEWFRGSNPIGRFKAHRDAIKGWVGRGEPALGRYQQWQRLSFEDWGYGRTISPPCASILFSHQLYLADGFVQGADIGIDRLETDMEAWRMALGQAKTLPVKTLAIQAINDDIAVASGLLVQPDFDGKYLSRLTKLLRPLDQAELSIRWPMQSELVSATKAFEAHLKAERAEGQTLTAAVASALPLPKQRRYNAYADYYEASYKAAGEGRHGALPKWKNYIQFPPSTVMDYLTNPIENIVGLEPLAPWDLYDGLVVDTDARLRLASLQVWLRRGPQDADLLVRIAKAGQNFYDPYTGLPMLVNLKKGVMYSVGHDGKDQDADPQFDVVVAIPANPGVPAGSKPSSGSSKAK